jgi:hypothetical protein
MFIVELINGQSALSLWFWPVISLSLFSAGAVFFTIIKKPIWLDFLFFVVCALIAVLLFPKNLIIFGGILLFLLICFGFQHRLRIEINHRLDFHIRPVTESALQIMIYGFLVLIATNVYLQTEQKITQNPELVYDRITQSAISNFSLISRSLGIKFDGGQSMDDILLQSLQKRDNDLGQSVLKDELNKVIDLERDFTSKQVGVQKDGTTTSVLASYFADAIKTTLKPFEKYLPLLFSLAVIGVLRLFGFVFQWLTIFLTWGLFHVLLKFNFFKYHEETVIVKKLDV